MPCVEEGLLSRRCSSTLIREDVIAHEPLGRAPRVRRQAPKRVELFSSAIEHTTASAEGESVNQYATAVQRPRNT
jgi:hypothetical protein